MSAPYHLVGGVVGLQLLVGGVLDVHRVVADQRGDGGVVAHHGLGRLLAVQLQECLDTHTHTHTPDQRAQRQTAFLSTRVGETGLYCRSRNPPVFILPLNQVLKAQLINGRASVLWRLDGGRVLSAAHYVSITTWLFFSPFNHCHVCISAGVPLFRFPACTFFFCCINAYIVSSDHFLLFFIAFN